MTMTRFGILSGAIWGVAASLALVASGAAWPSPAGWLVFIATGAAVGLILTGRLRAVPLTPARRIAAASLAGLFASAALFAVLLAMVEAVRVLLAASFRFGLIPELLIGILLAPLYWMWGLVTTGLVVVFWPLAALNLWCLERVRRHSAHPTPPGTSG